MDNEKLKAVYFDLRNMLMDFRLNTGGKNAAQRNAEHKTRGDIIKKTQRLIEGNTELLEIINTCASYHFLDQHFFEDQYFDRDMTDFLEKVNEKYSFTR
jgi:hypothetical protein